VRPPDARLSDERIELAIGTLLRAGVLLAAGVGLVGAIAYIARYGSAPVHYAQFHGVPAGLDSVHGVVVGALALRSRWVIQLGLLLLIATPVARVALSLVSFLLQRDRTYVVVTAIVLGLLLYGLVGLAS
jgi:uncharacterized membrane protein